MRNSYWAFGCTVEKLETHPEEGSAIWMRGFSTIGICTSTRVPTYGELFSLDACMADAAIEGHVSGHQPLLSHYLGAAAAALGCGA